MEIGRRRGCIWDCPSDEVAPLSMSREDVVEVSAPIPSEGGAAASRRRASFAREVDVSTHSTDLDWKLVQAIRDDLEKVFKSELQIFKAELRTWLKSTHPMRTESHANLHEEKYVPKTMQVCDMTHSSSFKSRNMEEGPEQSARTGHSVSSGDHAGVVNDIQVSPSQSPSDSEIEAFEAIRVRDVANMSRLLHAGVDPNAQVENLQIGKKTYSVMSLLPAAVASRNVEMVRTLVSHGANLSSKYSFLAGSTNMLWSGNSCFFCPPTGNLEMLQVLVELSADVHERASNHATLVWDCAYFGQHQMLQYVLEDLGVDSRAAAASQDQVGVSYSPLHISVIAGHRSCVQLLLDSHAEVNTKTEKCRSPLDDALWLCQPEIVTTLVAHGALLVDPDQHDERPHRFTTRSLSSKSSKATRLDVAFGEINPLDQLFHVGNPMVVRAAALGLQQQEEQVKRLPVSYLIDFLENSSGAKTAIIKALFRQRRIQYRGKRNEVMERKSAFIFKSQELPGGKQHCFPIVVKRKYSFSEFQKLFKERKHLDDDMLDFLDELAPQKDLRRTCTWDEESHAASVATFECLMPRIDSELRVIKAIKDTPTLDEVFKHMHCQAIIHSAWLKIYRLALAEVFAHVAVLTFFIFAAEQLRGLTSNNNVGGANPASAVGSPGRDMDDIDSKLRMLSCIALPFWAFAFFRELLDLLAHVEHGWALDYIMDTSNYLDVFRISADTFFVFRFLLFGTDRHDSFAFRVAFSLCCFFKWTKIMYCLTPFGRFGLPVMPILFATRDIGPFVLIMMVYIAGIAHAFAAMDLADKHYSWNFVDTFFFGTLGEFDKIPEFYYPQDSDAVHRWFMQAILAGVTFLVPITLMNIFIAALGASYDTGVDNMEQLYQSRKAESVFGLLALKRVVTQFQRWRNKHEKTPLRLWYCCERVDEEL